MKHELKFLQMLILLSEFFVAVWINILLISVINSVLIVLIVFPYMPNDTMYRKDFISLHFAIEICLI